MEATLLRGRPGAGGYVPVLLAPGEGLDAQSPLRVEYLDRYDDGEPRTNLVAAAYRPQELLTAQVAEAMVRAVNDVSVGPVTGSPLAFTLQTGDNSDSSQRNEIRWNIDLLDGSIVRPDSGDLSRFEASRTRTRSGTTPTTGIRRARRRPVRTTWPADAGASRSFPGCSRPPAARFQRPT